MKHDLKARKTAGEERAKVAKKSAAIQVAKAVIQTDVGGLYLLLRGVICPFFFAIHTNI